MNLSSPLPAGLILIALIAGLFVGVAAGWVSRGDLDGVLRRAAVRRAVRDTVAALEPATEPAVHVVSSDSSSSTHAHLLKHTGKSSAVDPSAVGMHAGRLELAPAVAGPTTTPTVTRPGMPYLREDSKGVIR